MKLVQQQFLKGTREFEISGTTVTSRIKTLRTEKTLSVELSMINPEPVVNGSLLEFHSRVKCDPLVSLLIDKPNAEEYSAFVETLKQQARDEYNAFAGLKVNALPAGMEANVFEEPVDFGEQNPHRSTKKVSVASIDSAIQMLEQYLQPADIKPLLSALESLKAEPENEACFHQLVTAFEQLGPQQGAVLTYAPYVGLLLSDDPFGF